MRLRDPLIACSMLAILGGLTAPIARAQGPAPVPVRAYDATQAQRLFADLMSPFCPGRTLATCPSPGADSLRNDIRTRLSLGESPRAIRAAYAATWGEEILGAPRWRGWGVVLWSMPAVMLAVGAGAVGRWMRRARRLSGNGSAAEHGVAVRALTGDESLARRLEEELAAFDDG